jgi:hypothetical protein
MLKPDCNSAQFHFRKGKQMADNPTPAAPSSNAPHPKVVVGGLAGAVTAIVIWVAQSYGKTQIPPEVASAATAIISTVLAYIIPASSQ